MSRTKKANDRPRTGQPPRWRNLPNTIDGWLAWDLPTHRLRRGKVVEIPVAWRGHVTHPQTQRDRQSHEPRKARRFGYDGEGSRTHALHDAVKEGLE